MSKKDIKNWLDSASKELKRKNLEDLSWETPEGIKVKPLYTEDDTKNLNHEIGLPGLPNLLLEGLEQLCIPIDLGQLGSMLIFHCRGIQ